MNEEWRPVMGWEGLYEISSLGRCRSIRRTVIVESSKRRFSMTVGGRIRKPGLAKEGYLVFVLIADEKRVVRRAHQLVLEAFVGLRPEGTEGCHNNGTPSDNRLSNLRWDTPRNNYLDTIKHGTQTRGERHGCSKLTEDEVRFIRSSAIRRSEIAKMFGVYVSTISKIRAKKTWGHI